MDFQVGQRLEVDFEELKCLTTLRGWIPEKVLFVDLPRGARRGDLIQKGMVCKVQYVMPGEIRWFESAVEDLVRFEVALIYLRYPAEVHQQRLRSELRLETDFGVWICNARGEGAASKVLDLSRGGCLLEQRGIRLSLGDSITLWGILPNSLLLLNVPCIVRRLQKSSRVGVEFGELDEDQTRTLELYLGAAHRLSDMPLRSEGETRGVVGELQEVPLALLVRLIAASGRSYELDVWDEPRTGRLYFGRGVLSHAKVGSLRGGPAFYELMRWGKGQFCVSVPAEIPHRNVVGDLDQLLQQPTQSLRL